MTHTHGYIALLPDTGSNEDYPTYNEGPVWGAGYTEQDALEEALGMFSRDPALYETGPREVAVLPATAALVALVTEDGGDVPYVRNGYYYDIDQD